MTPDDPTLRPTTADGPPAASADATRTYSHPASTLPYNFGPPIVGPVDTWPAGLTRYRPLHLLGDGGMGEVYLAHDTQLDRQVAIKFARRTTADTADRILAEARAAARLHHAGICPVFDADVCDGVPYLTMAFVQGPTLAAELKRLGPCPPAYAVRLIRSVAEAMQYAHDHGVIHRDLKPANILLTADHTPIVTDFGLAVRLDREGLAHGVISGTPHYMAPEQAAGDAVHIGERTDVFALGVILFEMLAGRVPFDGPPREVLEQVKTKAVPPLRKVRRQVPERVARIVAKATARNPADRYESMTAFADALSDFLRSAQATPKKKAFGWVWWLAAIPAGMLLGGCLLVCGIGLVLPAIQKWRNDKADRVKAAKESTESVGRFVEEGDALAAQGRTAEAEAKYGEAIKLDADAVTPRVKRAEQFLLLRRDQDALADLNRVIELDPNNARAYYLRAIVKERLNDLAGSDADDRRATDLSGTVPAVPLPKPPDLPPAPGK